MGLVDAIPRRINRAPRPAVLPDVAVLEDETALAELAAEICAGLGLRAATYRTPATFLADFDGVPPRLVILDWRLEREIGAATFMALRHRFGDVPIVCWTGLSPSSLPAMVLDDARTELVRKASGVAAFEAAVRRATASPGPATNPQTEGAPA